MTIYLIRGLPGSGKSTYAKKLGYFHIEADMFHMRDGEYKFDGGKAKMAHEWCQTLAFDSMSVGIDLVVSNTFTQKWEMQPYIDYAKKTGYTVKVIRMIGQYGSVHNVPEDVIKKMSARFESFDGEKIVL